MLCNCTCVCVCARACVYADPTAGMTEPPIFCNSRLRMLSHCSDTPKTQDSISFSNDERRWWLRLSSYVVQKFSNNQITKCVQWIVLEKLLFSADQEIPRILCNPKVHNPAHNSPLLAPIPSHMNTDQNLPTHLTHWGWGHLNCLNARYRSF